MLIYLQSLSKLGSRCKTCYSAVKKTRSSTTIDASIELQCMELDKRLVQEAPDQKLRSDISGSRYPLRYIQQETKTDGKNLQSLGETLAINEDDCSGIRLLMKRKIRIIDGKSISIQDMENVTSSFTLYFQLTNHAITLYVYDVKLESGVILMVS